MKTSNFIMFLGMFCLILAFTSLSSAYTAEGVYYKLCKDANCENYRAVFEVSESPIYLRAYNYNSTELSGSVRNPSGETKDLSFNNGIARISFSSRGTYYLDLQNDGNYKSAQFLVVDKLPSYTDLGNSAICNGVSPLVLDYSKNQIISRSLDSISKQDRFVNLVKDTNLNSNLSKFNDGTYNSSWRCPPTNTGVSCSVSKDMKKLNSYYSNTVLSECNPSVEGKFNIYAGKFIFGSKDQVLKNALEDARDELSSVNNKIVCTPGCGKKVSFGLLDSKPVAGGVLGNSFIFSYKIDCVLTGNNSDLAFYTSVKGEQRCTA